MTPSTTGTVGELAVAIDLMRRGWDVYRALSADCRVDLMAERDGLVLRIEVRSGYRSAAGKVYWPRNEPRAAGPSSVPGLRARRRATEADIDHYAVIVSGELAFYEPPLAEVA